MAKSRILCFLIVLCMFLAGCGALAESYVSVTPHQEQGRGNQNGMVSAANYSQLRAALENMVQTAQESGVINVADYDSTALESGMAMAARYVDTISPIGAYAVSELRYEIGSNGGKPAVAVDITYSRSRIEIQKIQSVADMAATAERMYEAMEDHDASLVILVEDYQETDFSQLARDYAESNPGEVMEIPQVSVGLYGTGNGRLAEFTFTYQNSRENLRQMKSQVSTVFASADLYVRGDAEALRKYAQLYAFLMERFDYTLETSITPAYSLLCHGVGDSRAFATVYAAMCRRAGLECMTVTGTHAGEPRTWNIICDNGTYYHVDLLRSNTDGWFRGLSDRDMAGYVWDYSAFPACGGVVEEVPEETVRTEEDSSENS